MDKAHIIWGFQWVFYCLIHSFLANNYIKDKATYYLKVGSNGYRIAYNCNAFVHLSALVWFHIELKSPLLFSPGVVSTAFAIGIGSVGLGIMLICVAKYFRQLSGISGGEETTELYTSGLHRYVRHPLYLGTFIFLIGLFLYWPFLKNAMVALIIIVYTLFGILLEEKKLLREFGSAYQRYQQKVPMIIPGLRTVGKKTNPGTGTLIN
jgi:protein-S-isoprenylcysteine O-methyltransferase Ste14